MLQDPHSTTQLDPLAALRAGDSLINGWTSLFGPESAGSAAQVEEKKRMLEQWLTAHVPAFRGRLELCTKFAGGQSNPTFLLETSSARLVLRRKPFGQLLPSAHAVEREFRISSALHRQGFPVAQPYGLCADQAVVGSTFCVMEYVEGQIHWNGAMPGNTPAERRRIYLRLVETLARLHAIDPDTIGLDGFGRPGNYFGRQLDRWIAQYRLSETERIDEIERVMAWLARGVPDQSRTAIVHGDFRIDNVIFDRRNEAPLAVLDWELSTLGDPLGDFSYFALAWALENEGRSGLADIDRSPLGIPELGEIVDQYCAATGRGGIPDLNWYFAFNLFRLVAILQGVKRRSLDGNASSGKAEAMAARIPGLAVKAWDFACAAGA